MHDLSRHNPADERSLTLLKVIVQRLQSAMFTFESIGNEASELPAAGGAWQSSAPYIKAGGRHVPGHFVKAMSVGLSTPTCQQQSVRALSDQQFRTLVQVDSPRRVPPIVIYRAGYFATNGIIRLQTFQVDESSL